MGIVTGRFPYADSAKLMFPEGFRMLTQHFQIMIALQISCAYRIACNFRGVKISFILKKEIFVSKNFVLPGSGRGRRRPTRFFVGEKFRGGQLTHENNEIFTPRKLHAIRYAKII